jgi:hypothetical protein
VRRRILRRAAQAKATSNRAPARPTRRWAGLLALPADSCRALAALLAVEPMYYCALRRMAERAVYNFHLIV